MTLDELIAQMTNPQEFTRLCNSVFTDIYRDAFQVIDGTRGDNGNDGYVATERRMLAVHCPMKPEQKTDAGYLEKITADLAKAAALKREDKYEIEAWTFVTPRKLGDGVIQKMRALGEKVGIRTSHQESTFLANELNRRGHLLKGFPALQQIDLKAAIDEMLRAVKAKREDEAAQSAENREQKATAQAETDDARLEELASGLPNPEAKAELKALAYAAADPILEINANLALLNWFDPVEDDRSEFVGFARRGVDSAKRCGSTEAEALFHAHIAALLLWDFNTGVINAGLATAADFLLPFLITPIEQTQQGLTRLRQLEENWKAETAAAMRLIKESRDQGAVARVLVVLGSNMGQLAHTQRMMGEKANADRFLAHCKTLLMAAKDAFLAAGDDDGANNSTFNLANRLRWHGGKAEALALVKSIIPKAEAHGNVVLLQKAKWLQHTLETGEIPDYAAGERRTWTIGPPG
jgi:hypothetical protein